MTPNTVPYIITIELDENGLQEATSFKPADAAALLAENSELAIQAAMEKIKDLGERAATAIRSISQPPEESTVEFGLKLGAEAGVIAKGTGEAHFVVTLKWRRRTKDN